MIERLNDREKKMLAVLGVLLLGYIFYSFIYLPQTNALNEAKIAAEQKQSELASLQSELKQKNQWEKERLEFTEISLPQFLGQISNLANSCQVQIKSFRPEDDSTNGQTKTNSSQKQSDSKPTDNKEAGSGQTTLGIIVEGDFLSLKKFFLAWESDINSAILTQAEFQPAEKNENKLQAKLTVKALFL